MRVKYVGQDVSYVTGPISGPVTYGDVHEVSDEDGASLVASGVWTDQLDEPSSGAAPVGAEEPQKSSKKQAIAKADVTKEVQSQDQQ
jgi:hypothetical protein